MEQTNKLIDTTPLSRRTFLRGVAGGALAMGAGQLLAGCSGGGGGGLDIGNLVFGPDAVQISLIDGSASPVRLGRSFVGKSSSGQPTQIGFELLDGALAALTPLPFNVPTVFRDDMPAGSIFKQLGLSYWTGHDPRGIGEVPHFHAVFLLQPVQPPDFPFLTRELTPVAPGEVPPGFIDGRDVPTAVVPGVGNGFEDPTLPHMNPHWYGITYNFFYYDGHLNGIGIGATTDFLEKTETQSMNIAQPSVYPKAGAYPHRLRAVYNQTRKSHFFVLEDMRAASSVLP